jgi:hypothetical protein
MIHTPDFYLFKISDLIDSEIEKQFEILAADQAKLEEYKAKFPDKNPDNEDLVGYYTCPAEYISVPDY